MIKFKINIHVQATFIAIVICVQIPRKYAGDINFKPASQIIENELKPCAAISHRPIRENTFEGIEEHDACNRIIAQFAKKLVVCRATNQGRRILPGGNLLRSPATALASL